VEFAAVHQMNYACYGAVEVNALTQGALRRCTQWPWIEHPPFQLRGGPSTTELSPPHRNVRRQRLGFRWRYDVPLGRYWGTNDRRKWIKACPDYLAHRHFMQSIFIRFWVEGEYIPRSTGALIFVVWGWMSSHSYVDSDGLTPPSVIKMTWFQDKHCGTSAHWI